MLRMTIRRQNSENEIAELPREKVRQVSVRRLIERLERDN